MMLLSSLIDKKCFEDYIIEDEKEVDVLAIIESQNVSNICTFLENDKFMFKIDNKISMVITNDNLKMQVKNLNKGVIITSKPGYFYFKLHNYLAEQNIMVRPDFPSKIDSTAQISPLADVAGRNVEIGKNVIIEPFVMLYENVKIGDNSIVRAGSRIGGGGFEFKRGADTILPVKHNGGVQIGERVEIQNNCCIDRAVYFWDDTKLGDDTKLDSMVRISHASKIGKRVLIAASTTLSGRVEIGDDSWIGIGSTISNGIKIGSFARVNIGSVVTKDVEDGESVTGNFAIPHKKFITNLKNSCRDNETILHKN